jgi:hypothetical protein
MWLKGATQQLLHNDLKMGTKKYPADHSGQGAVFYKMDLFFFIPAIGTPVSIVASQSLQQQYYYLFSFFFNKVIN